MESVTSQPNINSNYSLNNLENYKLNIPDNAYEIIHKYYSLVNEYLSFVIENVWFKNVAYTRFVIERGLETITHVFTILLYYSRNLDLTYYHSQKSFYFYVEYIGQISEDKHTFLQLSSRDASMFVYKKTIFEISNEIRKNSIKMSSDDIKKIDILNINIEILMNMNSFILERDHTSIKKLNVIFNEILQISFSKNDYLIILSFISAFKPDKSHNYIETIKLFIQKYSKMKPEAKYNISEKTIKEKLSQQITYQKLDESQTLFIKWVLC